MKPEPSFKNDHAQEAVEDLPRKTPFMPKFILLLASIVIFIALIRGFSAFQQISAKLGAAAPTLSFAQKISLILSLSGKLEEISQPVLKGAAPLRFQIQPGDSLTAVLDRLRAENAEFDSAAARDYMVYRGYDRRLLPGSYLLQPGVSLAQIGEILTAADQRLIPFSILPGMRLEEIAALIPSSGFEFSADDFLNYVKFLPEEQNPLGFEGAEGLLPAGNYEFERNVQLQDFVANLIGRFGAEMYPALKKAQLSQGLNAGQAAFLASLITREAMLPSEYEMVASVFLNRLRAGMPLQSDPSVQYALGWDAAEGTWWKNRLTAADLAVVSPFNTYLLNSSPPHPICSFSLAAIEAVANAPVSGYYYFRLSCDGSPSHVFSATYEEHLQNACE